MAFYNHALQAVAIGRKQFAEAGVPFKRPEDFFCESLKSDGHMARVSMLLFSFTVYRDCSIDQGSLNNRAKENRRF
jgi:hypothetical protein